MRNSSFTKITYRVKLLTYNKFSSLQTKCIKYWPDDQETFGSVKVSTVAEEVFADYTVRTLGIRGVRENIL